jgi:hypothetical protein
MEQRIYQEQQAMEQRIHQEQQAMEQRLHMRIAAGYVPLRLLASLQLC